MIPQELFDYIFPKARDPKGWVTALNDVLPNYGIDTRARIAVFLSQCGVETAGWRWFEENLNYSAERMMVVWPRIFDERLAHYCAHKPDLVANYAYGGRMGNGPPESGDGWKYRGRGPIHLTGKNNYGDFSFYMYGDARKVLDNPDLVLLDYNTSLETAVWYWETRNINELADQHNIHEVTKRVNGGFNGLQQRMDLFHAIYDAL